MSGNKIAAYASDPAKSRGRLFPEPDSNSRSEFQRDRDRVVHSTAFRRLKHKTQVFIYHEGDHYRTRLTHTIEVAQIARTIARKLNINEDLAEVVALAHDLGHPPFGHAGERALADAMAAYGGFDHNAQTLRIVTNLERRYADFNGLNLTWETLEGMVKHNGPMIGLSAPTQGLPYGIAEYCEKNDLHLNSHASLEAQVAAIADDIAYNSHDLDDGVRAGLIEFQDMTSVPVLADCLKNVDACWQDLAPHKRLHEMLRRLISLLVEDVIDETEQKLVSLNLKSAMDIRNAGQIIASFSKPVAEAEHALKIFLRENLYHHEKVDNVMHDASQVVSDLFSRYMGDPSVLPIEWKNEQSPEDDQPRTICDFVAGMTDRFAMLEHARLFDRTPELR